MISYRRTMGLFLALLILIALSFCVSRHGLISFMTLGCVGMAIYSIPGVIGMEMPFWVAASTNNRFLLPVPSASQWVLAAAWVSFAAGIAMARSYTKREYLGPIINRERFVWILRGCAPLCIASYAYSAATVGPLYFLADRADQLSDSVTLVSKWFFAVGIIASILIGARYYTAFFLLFLAITFLGGDRTMVAIVTAAALIALSYRVGGARILLSGRVIVFLSIATIIVLFGKMIYISIKNYFGIGAFEHGTSIEATLLAFEPLGIFSHLSYVMDTSFRIGFSDFLSSVLGNLLIVPSAFGITTNLYNELIQGGFSFNVTYGVAGSYLAHGWAVGGVVGVIFFYLFYALALAWCDRKFAYYSGLRKALVACAGGVLAFYAHRNGMDNLGSFLRQIVIAGVIVAFIATIVRVVTERKSA